jgi:D-arabinose 1-dehydrogenase-like Zn-dependent alcohol dehydrogenase
LICLWLSQEAFQIAGDGNIKPRIDVRKFKDVNKALDDLASGKVTGRLVLEI